VGRIGWIGFGGPPAHITLFRRLCVDDRKWISADEFQDAIAATNLLPGPASTQLAIFCAWRLLGPVGAIVARRSCGPSDELSGGQLCEECSKKRGGAIEVFGHRVARGLRIAREYGLHDPRVLLIRVDDVARQ
jgi:hypothetical protein